MLEGLDDFVVFYVDDVMIFSNTYEEHLRHIDMVLDRIEDANMTLNLKKCQWAQSKLKFLGLLVDAKGERTSSIRDFPRPTNKREIQPFLETVNFYRGYIPEFAQRVKPLYELLSDKVDFVWHTEQENVFTQLKEGLCHATLNAHPDFSKTFYIRTDASAVGIAGAIYQLDENGDAIPLVFHSRILQGPELNYTVMEQELLAVVYILQKNYYILLSRKICLYTDHKALIYLKLHPLLAPRVTR